MQSDTEIPTAPLSWAESIHGDLVLVDRVQADGWQQMERGTSDPGERVVAGGVASLVERGAGTSLLLKTPQGQSATTLEAQGGQIFVITHLGGEGDETLRQAVAQIPDEAFTATGARFTVGFVGLVLFDGAASWEMASESMLYVFLEIPKGEYEIDTLADHTLGEHTVRVLRLRPVN